MAEDCKGALEVGKDADLCVLDADLELMDPHDMPEMRVVLTMADGDVVHQVERLGSVPSE